MQACVMQLCTSNSEYNGEWKWQAAGMSYVIRTEGDRLIVVDGGETEEDATRLLRVMKKLTNSEHPTVAMWILTHPHPDHYKALYLISENPKMLSGLDIQQLCYQLPEKPLLPRSGVTYTKEDEEIRIMTERLGVPVTVPHTGDILTFDGLTIRFFFTPENCLERLTDVNELSLIFQVCGKHKSIMFTGDAYERTTKLVAFRFWDDLKSDYCQLAHHGLNGGSTEFYARVNAPHVLIPISASGDRAVSEWNPGTCPRQFAERCAHAVHKAYRGDEIFNL